LAETQLFENMETEDAKKSKHYIHILYSYIIFIHYIHVQTSKHILLAISTYIPVQLMTGFVIQGLNYFKITNSRSNSARTSIT